MTTFARSSTERAIFTKWEPRTSAAVSRSASSGVQRKLARPRRKRSVELSVTSSPAKRMCTPVSTGRFSSWATATAAWVTVCVKVSASTWPICGGSCGRSGYSLSGMSCSVNVAGPEVMVIVVSLAER